MPIRIGVRLAKVGPPPLPPSSARAAAAAAAASEEAPARCSKVRRVISRFMVSVLPRFEWDDGGSITFSIGELPAIARVSITSASAEWQSPGGYQAYPSAR